MITLGIKNVPAGAEYWGYSILNAVGGENTNEEPIDTRAEAVVNVTGNVSSIRFMVYNASGVYLGYAEIGPTTLAEGKTYIFDWTAQKFTGSTVVYATVMWGAIILGAGIIVSLIMKKRSRRK